MKYVIVHIIKGKVVAFAKCKTKAEVIGFAIGTTKQVGLQVNSDYLWKNRHLPYNLTEQSCLQIL